MCGIAGFSWRDEDLVRAMGKVMAHRGPDQYGFYVDQEVSLAHQRLSIIDLTSHGRQPMGNEDGTVWVTYNGEIYNFRELRSVLEGKGHKFQSQCDTEVIVHAYEEYGAECVTHFNGMFAFAIWDQQRKELILARDRLGIKPLYYYANGKKFVFASEIKAILQAKEVERELNIESLCQYLGYEFVPAPETLYRGIKKLPAGHYLRFQEEKGYEITRYWDLRFQEQRHPATYYEEGICDILTEAVRKRLMSDVPLGVFLSGGLDSSAVVALMKRCGVEPIQTFSLGYEDPSFSELGYARIMAKELNTVHHEIIIDPISPSLIERTAWHLDEPMTDLSTISFYLICQKAREHVTVCLSGEGGDEVLVGYDRFKASKAHGYYALFPKWLRQGLIGPLVAGLPDQSQKKGFVNILKRFIQGGMLPDEGGHMRWQYFGTEQGSGGLLKSGMVDKGEVDPFAPIRHHTSQCNSQNRLDREIYIDLKFMMSDSVLMKVDKMSMAHALEVRVPFLDHQFVEFCAGIPGDLKLKGFQTKAVFRSAMKGILPDSIRGRGKQGYSLPIKNWLRDELKEYTLDTLQGSDAIQTYFNRKQVDRVISEHFARTHNRNHELWGMLNFAVWHRLFIEGEGLGNSRHAVSSTAEQVGLVGNQRDKRTPC